MWFPHLGPILENTLFFSFHLYSIIRLQSLVCWAAQSSPTWEDRHERLKTNQCFLKAGSPCTTWSFADVQHFARSGTCCLTKWMCLIAPSWIDVYQWYLTKAQIWERRQQTWRNVFGFCSVKQNRCSNTFNTRHLSLWLSMFSETTSDGSWSLTE